MTQSNLKELALIHDENIKLKDEIKMLKSRSKWISIKDRLPEDDQEIMVYYKCDVYSIIRYDAFGVEEFINYGITHWMELPERPKE